jgi:hypothetical protein
MVGLVRADEMRGFDNPIALIRDNAIKSKVCSLAISFAAWVMESEISGSIARKDDVQPNSGLDRDIGIATISRVCPTRASKAHLGVFNTSKFDPDENFALYVKRGSRSAKSPAFNRT